MLQSARHASRSHVGTALRLAFGCSVVFGVSFVAPAFSPATETAALPPPGPRVPIDSIRQTGDGLVVTLAPTPGDRLQERAAWLKRREGARGREESGFEITYKNSADPKAAEPIFIQASLATKEPIRTFASKMFRIPKLQLADLDWITIKSHIHFVIPRGGNQEEGTTTDSIKLSLKP